MIISPSAEPVTDVVRIDVLERNEDGSIKTSRIVEIDEVLLLRKTDGETYEKETFWKREE